MTRGNAEKMHPNQSVIIESQGTVMIGNWKQFSRFGLKHCLMTGAVSFKWNQNLINLEKK